MSKRWKEIGTSKFQVLSSFIRNIKYLSGLRYTYLKYCEMLTFPFCNHKKKGLHVVST